MILEGLLERAVVLDEPGVNGEGDFVIAECTIVSARVVVSDSCSQGWARIVKEDCVTILSLYP